MDKKLEIQLPSLRYIDAVNVDMDDKIALGNQKAEINEYDIRNVLSATEVFDAEREASEVYRIYGRIEWASILNGITPDYSTLQDFFLPYYYLSQQTILAKFDFYLVRPSTGYTKITTSNTRYIRYFEVIATPTEIDLFPAGFAKNVFNDQNYIFNINIDIDVSDYYDEFGFPVTELYLYCQYKKNVAKEITYFTLWSPITGNGTDMEVNFTTLNIGDYVVTENNAKIGDIVEYTKSEFLQEQYTEQLFYVATQYNEGTLAWKYNPFIPIRLRYLSDSLYQINTGSTTYNNVQAIPNYATPIDTDGNVVWRTILPDGYIDPLTGTGTDNPFINKRRYSFSSLVLDTLPNLSHSNTAYVFSEINFNTPTEIDITPINDDINDIGKPCK